MCSNEKSSFDNPVQPSHPVAASPPVHPFGPINTHGGNQQDDLYELRRAIFILAEQIGRIMSEKKNDAERKPSLSERFADQVALMGISDAIKGKKPVLKWVWIVIFVVAFSITGYLVYRVVDEYRQNPTATKVTVLRNDTYAYPSVVLCLDTWFSLRRATDLGLTRRAVRYALSYLMRYEDSDQTGGGGRPSSQGCGDDSDEGADEFFRIYRASNFSSLLDFYQRIALDSTIGDEFDARRITFDCKGCTKGIRSLPKVVVDRGVCYEVPLMAESGKLRGSDGLWRLSIQAPDLTDGLISAKPYWRLYINNQLGQIQPTAMFYSVDKGGYSTAITVAGQRFRVASTKHDPCVGNDHQQSSSNSTATRCATNCLSEDARRRFGCRWLSLETERFDRDPHQYCNRCSPPPPPVSSLPSSASDSRETIETDELQTCLASCPHECETWTYDGSNVDKHVSAGLQRLLAAANNQSEIRFDAAKIYFKNAAVLRGGYLTFTEVFTYSLETLIGTIGGTCGIWIGVGVLTIVQVAIFLAQFVSKGFRSIKRLVLKPYHHGRAARNANQPPPQPPIIAHIQSSRI